MGEHCVNLSEDVKEIKSDIKDIKQDLSEHMSRTAANEARIAMMEDFMKTQTERNNAIMDRFIAQAEANNNGSAKLIKTTLGLFAALAILVGALWKISQ